MAYPNRNLLWTHTFVDELARGGLRAVCIAPGSRSTPLTIAFAEHPQIRVYSLIDERSASFFALGLALATDQPVAVVCSSGTATANFYPAVIEAHYSGVPLLILTADRPPELRDSGANQTVDQVKLYGDHVLWSVDVAVPEAEPSALTLRSLRTLACRAAAKANGLPRGPVHLNFPFRKPLEPIPVSSDVTDQPGYAPRPDARPFTQIARGRLLPDPAQIAPIAEQVMGARRGLIVCGPRCPRGDFPAAVTQLAAAAGFPILADPLSGVRFGAHTDGAPVIGGYDTFLPTGTLSAPDLVLHFGAEPTSQMLINYLEAAPDAARVWFSADGIWLDADHRADHVLWADPAASCAQIAAALGSARDPNRAWLDQWRAAEGACWGAIEQAQAGEWFDGAVVAEVADALPDGGQIFIGNSLPVRHLDQFARPSAKSLRTYGSRGASGIDGVTSTALGAAAATDTPLALVTGDLSFYHDMNGLMAVARCGVKAVIVVINNDGGGIFRRLPVAEFDPPFTELFLTPHGLQFEPVVRMYGLDYARVEAAQPNARADFRAAFAAALAAERATVIEVITDSARDLELRRALLRQVGEVLGASKRA